MEKADIVVSERYEADMSHAVPIEPHAVVAQWQGDKVTIWSSTQVPFIARSGVATTLEIPESHVRVIVPYLGGGFGGKCEFHFEAHIAALSRAARRPVRLVFSREEEFLAPDHRREGQSIDLETGVMQDGTIVARRARLVLDGGAYTTDNPFFPQLAAMMAVGPYKVENVFVDSILAYSNTTPSGSVRAPTAPQACWAVEQHMDSVAGKLGIDPVEFRRKTIVRTGDEGPTRQVFDPIGAAETLDRAVEMIGYDRDLPEDEAIGVACGWWPSFGIASGAYLKLNGDGSGTIITGAQECGTGAVMALPMLAAEVLGMKPEDFSVLYQDTDAGPFDSGASGSQTTFNNGRAVLRAAEDVREQLLDLAEEELEAARADLELVDGTVRVKGSPTKSVSIPTLAEKAHGDKLLLGRGADAVPAMPEVDASGCTGRLGIGVVPRPDVHHPRGALQGRPRHRRRPRAGRRGVARLRPRSSTRSGANGQVEGGVVMGIGMALTEGTLLDEDGRQRNPHLLDYKLQTMSDSPPIKIHFVEIDTPNAGPMGSKGIGEPPCVPTPGAVANAIRKVTGRRIDRLPMTPERVWEAMQP